MLPRIALIRKLQPKLRMIADGDTTVNVVRAERCAALLVVSANASEEVFLLSVDTSDNASDFSLLIPGTRNSLNSCTRANAIGRVTYHSESG
jgi:hypothetical protein